MDRECNSYVATGEVTSLKHELRNDTVEGRASVSEALLASAKSTEVLNGPWDFVFEEVEYDSTALLCNRKHVSLIFKLRVAMRGRL
jgi:hypothetical protein